MANRSYLYALDLEPTRSIKDLSENNYWIPITHMLLVSDAPELVASELWNNPDPIAIRGRGEGGYRRCVALLELLKAQPELPDRAELEREIDATLEFLARPENRRAYYHLEGGEIFDLGGGEPIAEAARQTVRTINQLAADVDALVAARSQALFREATTAELREAESEWPSMLGLYFTDVLYFHFES
jgi:hypothetical protein